MAVGLPYQHDDKEFKTYQEEFEKLHSDEKVALKESDLNIDFGDSNGLRICASTHLFAVPTKHEIVNHLQKVFTKCYQDDVLLGLWHTAKNDLVPLKEILNIQYYNTESEFESRDKSKDKNGYLTHFNA